jgi:hypothetical protein
MAFVLISVGIYASLSYVSAEPVQRDRSDVKHIPRDDTVYLWNQPSQGFQSVVSLNAGADAVSLDVGILVPMTVRISNIEVVPGKEKEAIKSFNDLAVGKLMTASLSGKSSIDGMTEGDLWDGAQRGWLRDQMIKTGNWREKKATEKPLQIPAKNPDAKK